MSKQHLHIVDEYSSQQLRKLSEEVGRIAGQLDRLSSHTVIDGPVNSSTIQPSQNGLPQPSPEKLKVLIRSRLLRSSFLPAELFADPAWDILLDLLLAELMQHRVTVSSLCAAANVPATTALRWIKILTERGIVLRRDDPHDGRRVHVSLSRETSLALRKYLVEVGYGAI